MNQEQYELFIKLLEEFHNSGVLGKAIIPVGSWCMVLYKDYFRNLNYRPNLRTRDVDFLVDTNNVYNFKIDLSSSLERLNFMEKRDPTIDGNTKSKFVNPKLYVEFLTPLVGKPTKEKDRPQKISQLSIIAQPLRFMNFLLENLVTVDIGNLNGIKVPHPAYFGIHKILISQKRAEEYKKKKDLASAANVLDATIKNGEINIILEAIKYLEDYHQKHAKRVKELLKEDTALSLLDIAL